MITNDCEVHDESALEQADKMLADLETVSMEELGCVPPWMPAARTAIKQVRTNEEDNQ